MTGKIGYKLALLIGAVECIKNMLDGMVTLFVILTFLLYCYSDRSVEAVKPCLVLIGVLFICDVLANILYIYVTGEFKI